MIIKIPKEISVRPDQVSFTVIKKNQKNKVVNAPCYGAYMSQLSENTFDCIPNNTKTSMLSFEDFALWIRYCTAYGFMPSGTIPYRDKELNCLIIHGEHENKHRVYAALCCYRWSDSLAPLVYHACRLIEQRPDLNFYRIMHYVQGKYVTLAGHNFTEVYAESMGLYGTNARLNYMWPITFKYFFDPYSSQSLIHEANKMDLTQTAIAKCVKNNLLAKKHDDLLDEKWESLYDLPFDSNKFTERYNELLILKNS